MNRRAARVVVVGGGISGLVSAYLLEQRASLAGRQIEVVLVEGSARVGGAIRSFRDQEFLIEGGPDSFITQKPGGMELVGALGLTSRLVETRNKYRRTFVASGSSLQILPPQFVLLAPADPLPVLFGDFLSLRGKLRLMLEAFIPGRQSTDDESVASFVRRRLGREILERVAQPMMGGIYMADVEELSLAATFPQFPELERKYRSVIKGLNIQRHAAQQAPTAGERWSLFVSFDEGMQVLVDTLEESLRSTRILLGKEVRRVDNEQGWSVLCDDGEVLRADAVMVTTPAPVTAALLSERFAALRSELEQIPTTPSLTVSLAYREADVGPVPAGFGFVVPRTEGKKLWACTFVHQKYPFRAPWATVSLRAFYGGRQDRDLLELDDSELVQLAIREIRTWIPLRGNPILTHVQRHPRGMPLYRVGHLDRVARIEEIVARLPGLALAGNSYRGVGIPDCIQSAQRAVLKTLKDTLPEEFIGEEEAARSLAPR